MTKFYDLNIITNQNDSHLYEKLKTAIHLGYQVLALSQVVDFSSNATPGQINLNGSDNKSGRKQHMGKKKHSTPIPKENLIPAPIAVDTERLLAHCSETGDSDPAKLPESLQILNRCTFVMDNVDQLRFLKNSRSQKFDLLAVTPLNQQVFLACCESAPEIDILTLDTTEAWPIRYKRTNVHSLILKGAFFEFNYGPAIQSSYARRNLIGQTYMMNCLGRGKNIIISSGAQKPLELRGPFDICNLGFLFGFQHKQCHQLNSTRCESVLKHAGIRKFSKYGVTVTNENVINGPCINQDFSSEKIVLDELLKEEAELSLQPDVLSATRNIDVTCEESVGGSVKRRLELVEVEKCEISSKKISVSSEISTMVNEEISGFNT